MTTNERILDEYIKHQIYLLRYASGLTKEAVGFLLETENKLKRVALSFVAERDDSRVLVGQKALQWQQEYEKEITNVRAPAWAEIQNEVPDQMRNLALLEASNGAKIIEGAIPVAMSMVLPPPGHLKAIVNSQPLEGRTLANWLKNAEVADINRIVEHTKIGITQGMTASQIAYDMLGTKGTLGSPARKAFRDLESIILTTTNGIQNESKQALYAANSDIIHKEKFLATLDSRTTLVCMGNDGKVFPRGEGAQPPLHFRCRSLRVPLINAENLGDRPFYSGSEEQFVQEYADKEGLEGKYKSRADLPRGHKGKYDKYWKSQREKYVGEVPASTSYNDWLKKQSTEFQDEVLGPTRAKMFRNGDLSLDKFTARDGSTLTLKELAGKGYDIPEAYKKEFTIAPAKKMGEAIKVPKTGSIKRVVWDTADALAGQTRKEIIDACVEAGVHPSTAATTYSQWKKYRVGQGVLDAKGNLKEKVAASIVEPEVPTPKVYKKEKIKVRGAEKETGFAEPVIPKRPKNLPNDADLFGLSDELFEEYAWLDDLPELPRTSLESYMERGYMDINSSLRNGAVAIDPEILQDIANLDQIMEKMPLTGNLHYLYRGVDMVFPTDLAGAKKLIGQTITEKGFMSTTISPSVAAEFTGERTIMQFHIPKGQRIKGIYATGAKNGDNAFLAYRAQAKDLGMHLPGEEEVLLARGYEFRLTGVSEKLVYNPVAGRRVKTLIYETEIVGRNADDLSKAAVTKKRGDLLEWQYADNYTAHSPWSEQSEMNWMVQNKVAKIIDFPRSNIGTAHIQPINEIIAEVKDRFNMPTLSYVGDGTHARLAKDFCKKNPDTQAGLATGRGKKSNLLYDELYIQPSFMNPNAARMVIDNQNAKAVQRANKGWKNPANILMDAVEDGQDVDFSLMELVKQRWGDNIEKMRWYAADNPQEMIMHELGHWLHHRNRDLFDDILQQGMDELWHLTTSMYGMSSPGEYMAESMVLYLTGNHKYIYPKLLTRLKQLDKEYGGFTL